MGWKRGPQRDDYRGQRRFKMERRDRPGDALVEKGHNIPFNDKGDHMRSPGNDLLCGFRSAKDGI